MAKQRGLRWGGDWEEGLWWINGVDDGCTIPGATLEFVAGKLNALGFGVGCLVYFRIDFHGCEERERGNK